jgi:NAD(P)-dependent dehydrogenase (short-subunit alcohol dehydrogenase family)
MNLRNAVVFITGANRGLGQAFAKAALAAGAAKVYAAAREPASIKLPGVIPVQLDVTNADHVAAAVQACPDVTLLINNAGIFKRGPVLSIDSVDLAQAEMETNFLAPWRLSAAFAPVLARQPSSGIINVLSVLSWLSAPDVAAYCASKAAAWSLTNSLRQALAAQGTAVMGLHVGYMDTDMTAGIEAPKISPDDVARGALDALSRGATEYLADDISRQVKQSLSAPASV